MDFSYETWMLIVNTAIALGLLVIILQNWNNHG